MSKKKYIGKGKTTTYSENCQINLNDLFSQLYISCGNNKQIAGIFGLLKEELQKIEIPFINKWTNKDSKEIFELRISVSKRKEADKQGNDLYITLNEFN